MSSERKHNDMAGLTTVESLLQCTLSSGLESML